MAKRMSSATAQLNKGLRIFFSEFVRVSLRHPAQAAFFARTLLWQGMAARRRARMAREGVHVPPIAIFSITNGCNLPQTATPTFSVIDSLPAFPAPSRQPMEHPAPDSSIEALAALMRGRRTLVLSGAGMSTESGIPDYRGRQG